MFLPWREIVVLWEEKQVVIGKGVLTMVEEIGDMGRKQLRFQRVWLT